MMRVTNRIAVTLVAGGIAAVSVAAVGTLTARDLAVAERERVEASLTSNVESLRQRMQVFLSEVGNDLDLLSATNVTSRAALEFTRAFQAVGDDAEAVLQGQYIDDNPHTVERKYALLRAANESEVTRQYGAVHERYHGLFREVAQRRGYYDLFLVTAQGDIAYSVFKERDFATNLVTGAFKDTQLSETFARVREDPRTGRIEYRDFEPYAPSKDAPSTFIGVPLIDDGEFIGAFIVQLLAERLDEFVRPGASMGGNGAVYLVGPDLRLRSSSRAEDADSRLEVRVETSSTRAALEGLTGFGVVQDDSGVDVYSAYAPLDWQGVRWAVIAQSSTADVSAAVRALTLRVAALGLLCVALACLLGFALAWQEDTD